VGLSPLNSEWTEATSVVAKEGYAGGVAKGRAVNHKVTESMHEIGMAPSYPRHLGGATLGTLLPTWHYLHYRIFCSVGVLLRSVVATRFTR